MVSGLSLLLAVVVVKSLHAPFPMPLPLLRRGEGRTVPSQLPSGCQVLDDGV